MVATRYLCLAIKMRVMGNLRPPCPPPPLPLSAEMAFNHYSSLFKSGLLSELSSPVDELASHPWAAEYIPPRRGSLPAVSQEVPLSPTTNASSSLRDVEHSIASGDSLVFTFKKRRDPSEFRSFLSLDLAESQSLRSSSLKGKNSQEIIARRSRHTPASRRSMSTFPS